jgi:hypothetical protein
MPDSDVQLYVNSMARIRERINIIQTVNVNQINIPSAAFKGEFMFLQFPRGTPEKRPMRDTSKPANRIRQDKIVITHDR